MWLTRGSREDRDAVISAGALVLALVVATLAILLGVVKGLESDLREHRDTLRLSPATGQIAIVEVDGRSLQSLDSWPWPRSYYAEATRRLDRLGAAQIAFDIDFSSRSTPEEDASLAAAFEEIEQPVILPTFRQANLAGTQTTITEAMPVAEFREHAFLASVNVFPSDDGQITYYPNGVTTNGTARPSLANMLARHSGEVNKSYRVDQAIDPNTIPRISFVDLIEGRVDADDVRGKRIVFGATAIELGDRYPTALFGVQPGVVLQVQAAETLLQGRARKDVSQWFMIGIVAALLAMGLYGTSTRQALWNSGTALVAILATVLSASALALDQIALPYIPLAGPMIFLFGFLAVQRTALAAARLQAERMTDIASGIPNRAAMQKNMRERETKTVAVLRLADFGEIATVLTSQQIAELDRDIVKRLSLLAGQEQIYRLDSGLFGWFLPDNLTGDLDGTFASARALFTSSFEIGGERFRLSPHFGCVAGSITDAVNASELARKRGESWTASAGDLREDVQFRQRLLGELDDALRTGAIDVVFQPKLRLADHSINNAECLVRWNSPQLGHISPAEFIPILEERGRIAELTEHVLNNAVDRLLSVRHLPDDVNLAVNISAQLLEDESFVERTIGTLSELNAKSSGLLTLEITESAPLVDSVKARKALERLGEAGARISIDDYGTGQATLNYLQGFPAQELKLDQSFVRELIKDRKDRIMVQSTIELAHALDFAVVAEGVEDSETLEALAKMGCDYAQGWAISRPVSWKGFLKRRGPAQTCEAA